MFKTDRSTISEITSGRVYVFKFYLENIDVYKIGMCKSNRTIDRFMEVLKGFFTIYRYVPKASILKYKEFSNPLLVEKHLHKELEDYKYKFDKKFDGSTEFFTNIDIPSLLTYIDDLKYNQIIGNVTSLSTRDYDAMYKEVNTYGLTEDDIPF